MSVARTSVRCSAGRGCLSRIGASAAPIRQFGIPTASPVESGPERDARGAVYATRANPDLRILYERLIAAGKSKMSALGAAMRKLVHICFGVLKNQQPYEPRLRQSA